MNDIKTNREVYRFIIELVKEHGESSLTLESYLENLQQVARAHSHLAALPLRRFTSALKAAFDPPDDGDASGGPIAEGYDAWEKCISQQIQDLHEMRQIGILADPHRYFGLDAPSGARWYNFDPCTYLECAAAGALGGWQEGDDTGRAYVPGPVAVMDASGAVIPMDPRDIEEPSVDIGPLTWLAFIELIEAGQSYE